MDRRNIAEPDRENSVLGASDTPIGTKFGEKTSPRGGLSGYKSHNGSALSPLDGSSDMDMSAQLPPLAGMSMVQFIYIPEVSLRSQ